VEAAHLVEPTTKAGLCVWLARPTSRLRSRQAPRRRRCPACPLLWLLSIAWRVARGLPLLLLGLWWTLPPPTPPLLLIPLAAVVAAQRAPPIQSPAAESSVRDRTSWCHSVFRAAGSGRVSVCAGAFSPMFRTNGHLLKARGNPVDAGSIHYSYYSSNQAAHSPQHARLTEFGGLDSSERARLL